MHILKYLLFEDFIHVWNEFCSNHLKTHLTIALSPLQFVPFQVYALFPLLITFWVQWLAQNFMGMCDIDADYGILIHMHTCVFGVLYLFI